ncbi:MAG: DNRLRE domain-containing protein [Candidatus Cloacimonadota bacterium]|nr:DNRLRE domain-containing protein [Candidatus Cloacimonadota bacterium]
MNMNEIKITFLTIILTLLLTSSCSQKKNFLGFEEEIENKITTDTLSNSVSFIKSYISGSSNYQDNSKLIVGKFNGVEVRSLLKFKNLPDTSWIDTVNINSCEIVIKKKKLFNSIKDFDIKVYKVNKDWNENSVIWDSLNFPTNFQETDYNISFENLQSQDTLSFTISDTLVINWVESDSTNFGIMLKCDGNLEYNFIEFYSSETSDYPYLKISYTDSSGTDTTKIYIVSEDTFIGYDENIYYTEILNFPIIQNLYPTRTIFSFNINSDTLGLSSDEFEKITVNKAEIIFDSTMIDSSFISDSYLGLKAYYISDTTNIDYEYISGCQKAEFHSDDDLLKINITGIIQGYTRGELENNQSLIKSTTENKDFSYLKFCEDIKPLMKITYTKPILSE